MDFLLVNSLIGLMTIIYLFLRSKFTHWKRVGLPYVEPVIPFGNSKGLGTKYHVSEFLINMYSQLKSKGPICGVYMYMRAVALVTDLNLVKTILIKDFSNFPNRGNYFNEKDDPLTAHLFNIEDEQWKSLRSKLTPTFTSGKLKMMFSTVMDVSDKLVKAIDKDITDKSQIEIKDTLSRFTIDVIGTVAFGLECNSLTDKNAEFYRMGLKSFAGVNFLRRFLITTFRNLAKKLHFKNISTEISNFYMSAVRETVEHRENNPDVVRNDFMNLLIQMKNSKGENSLTFNQIAAQAFVFFLAGFETTSTAMTYCMYELSLNEELQEKARQSVKDAIVKHGSLNYEAVAELRFLEQCVNESLRKYPPAATLLRIAKKDYPVPNTKLILPKDSVVWIPVYAIHWDPAIYPKPEIFDPERFSPSQEAKRHPYAFIPFGEGPRVCIAMRFALMEAKIGLATLLLNYKFTLDKTKTSVPMKISPVKAVLTPAEGIYLNLIKIN
ncbi:unnamed protein product [Diamesa hyperborea]